MSDGITDALNASGDDIPRVVSWLLRLPARQTPREACNALLAAATRGPGPEGSHDWMDDRTVLAFPASSPRRRRRPDTLRRFNAPLQVWLTCVPSNTSGMTKGVIGFPPPQGDIAHASGIHNVLIVGALALSSVAFAGAGSSEEPGSTGKKASASAMAPASTTASHCGSRGREVDGRLVARRHCVRGRRPRT